MRDEDLLAWMAEAMNKRSGVMCRDLVRSEEVGAAFGVSTNRAAAMLRKLGAVQLPRCTRGGGVPAYRLFCIRDIEPHGAMSMRDRARRHPGSCEMFG
jgi:hypothetical protein